MGKGDGTGQEPMRVIGIANELGNSSSEFMLDG